MKRKVYNPPRRIKPGVREFNSLRTKVDDILPLAYSAVVIAAHRRGWSDEDIAKFLGEIDDIWTENLNDPNSKSLLEVCEEETGICLVGQTNI